MQDMISKIVEMDEKAQELTAEAQKRKADSQQEIAKAKEDIYDEYIARARMHIKEIEEVESKSAEKQWLVTKDKQEKTLKALNDNFSANGDSWVNSIIEKVLA